VAGRGGLGQIRPAGGCGGVCFGARHAGALANLRRADLEIDQLADDADLLGRGGAAQLDATITGSGCGSLGHWAARPARTPAAGPLAGGPRRFGDSPTGPGSRSAGCSGGSPAGRSCRLASCSGGATSRTAGQLEQQLHGLGRQLHPAFDSQLDAELQRLGNHGLEVQYHPDAADPD
jgi:hypothetical protein